ncbi:MAG: SpoIIE family protein phosphatase [Candidatus Krumholzibacteria bacterium]|jgi:hypothetical protein|nr:SpoIIE family protein phosphatase [Candidatus Krumholzibacteria bacterium]MDP7020883.1 SpoIIE family protein phosphatase [Candidatus Krumholzibacteria bacterium]
MIGTRHLLRKAKKSFPYFLLLMALLLSLAGLYDRWETPYPTFRIHNLRIYTSQPIPGGLRGKDLLLAVNGEIVHRDQQAMSLVSKLKGEEGVLKVLREGQEVLVPYSAPFPGLGIRSASSLRVLASLFILLAAAFVYKKRQDPLALLFLLLCFLLASLLSPHPRFEASFPGLLLELGNDLLSLFFAPLFLHFLILFPESRPRSLGIRLLIYLPSFLFAVMDAAILFAFMPWSGLMEYLEILASLHSVLLLLLALLVLLIKVFRRSRRRERYRLRLVLSGAALGLFPLLIFQILQMVIPQEILAASRWAPVFLVFLPLSFAYGMLGKDLLSLRQSALTLSRSILRSLFFIGLFLLLHGLFLSLSEGDFGGLGSFLGSGLVLALSLVLWAPVQGVFPGKGKKRPEDELLQSYPILSGRILSSSLSELQEALSAALMEDLGASWVDWYSLEEGKWNPDFTLLHVEVESEEAKPQVLPDQLAQTLASGQCLLAADLWDPYWASAHLGKEGLEFCRKHDWSILLSFPQKDSVSRLIVLGPQLRHSLHSPELLSRFQSLMPSLSLQLGNLSLLDRLAKEKQIEHELRLARQIQQSLIPSTPPERKGLELLGKMIPSGEVGGDYFDFLETADGHLGLALGDATGKGIPAALLMAGVAQTFHSQAFAMRSPAAVLSGMNQSLIDARSDPVFEGFFVAFFFALFNQEKSVLRFCNAGMPTPWIFRKNGEIERLHRGGPFLGISSDGSFQEGLLRLEAGDLLFLRSDGFEEQENEAGERFGEDRLLEWVKNHQSLPLSDLFTELIATIEDHAASAIRDDISLILMRLRDSC